jgi:iron-sulfur cluster assembly accessory protein
MQTNLTVTPAASAYLKHALAKASGVGLRVSIKKTGCSGYSYLPAIMETVNANDVAVQVADGVTVFLDSTWLHLLDGVTIDYLEEEKSGLKQKRLVFTNKKESGRCGCGESFHIE